MSNAVFPKLPGLSWEMKTKDEFFNLIQSAAAPGFETRLSLGPDPLVHFDLIYNWLRQPGSQADGPAQSDELMTIRGFHRARRADFDSFLLYAPDVTENASDGTVTGQVLTSDANHIAPLVITRGGFDENIYEAAGVNGNPGVAPVIKRAGTPIVAGTDYNIVGPGFALAGVTYPGLAVQFLTSDVGITADFSWYYRVRFAQGMQEYDKFLALLYSAQTVQVVTTRT